MTRFRLYMIEECELCRSGRPCKVCRDTGQIETRTGVVVETDRWRYCCERGHHIVTENPLLSVCPARSQNATEVYGPECGAPISYREFDVEVTDD